MPVKVPKYSLFEPASPASSRAMRGNRSRDTRPERMLRHALWGMGARYRKYPGHLLGKPDLVFPHAGLIVFCDGDFWHGRAWKALRRKLQSRANSEYWVCKIQANRERDRRTTALLRRAGWRVMRVWEGEVLKDPASVASDIIAACNNTSPSIISHRIVRSRRGLL